MLRQWTRIVGLPPPSLRSGSLSADLRFLFARSDSPAGSRPERAGDATPPVCRSALSPLAKPDATCSGNGPASSGFLRLRYAPAPSAPTYIFLARSNSRSSSRRDTRNVTRAAGKKPRRDEKRSGARRHLGAECSKESGASTRSTTAVLPTAPLRGSLVLRPVGPGCPILLAGQLQMRFATRKNSGNVTPLYVLIAHAAPTPNPRRSRAVRR